MNRLSPLNATEHKTFKKKAERAFKQLLKSKNALSDGIVPVTEAEWATLMAAADIEKVPHEVVLRCIRNYIDAVKDGTIKVKNQETFAFEFGYLYIYCVRQAATPAWDIVFLITDHFSAGEVALVDKLRRYVLYPQMYLYRFLTSDKAADNVLLLTYNLLKEDKLENAPANSFTIVLG